MTADLAAMIGALRSKDTKAQAAAAQQLAQLGEDAQKAAVPLVEACAADESMREWVTAALEGLGAPQATDVPALIALLKRTELDVAYWAATLLGRLHADAAPAVAALVEALERHREGAVRERAAWALGQIGPAASAALAPLRTLSSGHGRLARLAGDAVKQITS
ncbi:MAG TPA: HEAT repeat domain-containing protein [Pirellulales bacterium]|jgi:HEAT repeat protein